MISIKQQKRFWSRVDIKSNDECWLWVGPQSFEDHTGVIYFKRKKFRAHRLAYYLSYGIDPGCFIVSHTCGVQLCQNPRHLLLKTRNHDPSKPPAGKLTTQEVLEIVKLHGREHPYRALAEKYKVSTTAIHAILKGMTWSKITEIKYGERRDKHIYGEWHHKARLKEADVLEIIERCKNNRTEEVAEEFNVCVGTIYAILEGRSWSHLRRK